MAGDPSDKKWDLDAGVLCLDFANTADWHLSEHPEEELLGFSDLVSWNRAEKVLADDQARRLLRAAEERPGQAAEVLARAIDMREAFFRILVARLHGGKPEAQDLDTLNLRLAEAMTHARLTPADGGFRWGWEKTDDLRQVLWPAARSAAELLASTDLDRVGQCADDRGCGWLFFDTSRNHSRRWCSMEACGNRAKAKRHQARERVDA